MKAKDVIKHIQDYHPDDEIIILWWDSDTVADQVVSHEEWNKVVNNLDGYSFDDIGYEMWNLIENELTEIRK